MKKQLSACLVAAFCTMGTVASAENATSPKVPDPQMEAWIKASTPGDEHKLLQQYVGTWNTTTTFWMKPGEQPQTSTGTAQFESIFGGRFVKQTVKGTAMGQPFEGMGVSGYDNIKKHYTSVWMDSMGTSTTIGTGQLNAEKTAITDEGTMSCPMTPSGTRSYRAVWGVPVNNSFKYEMYGPDETGKEFKMMEVAYKKAS